MGAQPRDGLDGVTGGSGTEIGTLASMLESRRRHHDTGECDQNCTLNYRSGELQ
jgi:hypothetical protein